MHLAPHVTYSVLTHRVSYLKEYNDLLIKYDYSGNFYYDYVHACILVYTVVDVTVLGVALTLSNTCTWSLVSSSLVSVIKIKPSHISYITFLKQGHAC